MADGFGNYRIRTTSFNSVRNLVSEYRRVREIWRGPFKGIPFELSLSNRQGNAPDGKKRTYPVWSFRLKPRGGELRLTSGNFQRLVLSGNRAAELLSLPLPRDPTPEDDHRDAWFDLPRDTVLAHIRKANTHKRSGNFKPLSGKATRGALTRTTPALTPSTSRVGRTRGRRLNRTSPHRAGVRRGSSKEVLHVHPDQEAPQYRRWSSWLEHA